VLDVNASGTGRFPALSHGKKRLAALWLSSNRRRIGTMPSGSSARLRISVRRFAPRSEVTDDHSGNANCIYGGFTRRTQWRRLGDP
jgi:hypothetical protein